MTNGARAMTDYDPTEISETGGIKSVALTILSGVGALVGGGGLVGFFVGYMERREAALTSYDWVIVLGLAALFVICGMVLLKNAPAMLHSPATLGRREKLNRRIMVAMVALGAVIGMVMSASGDGITDASPFSSGALPPVTALILAGITGIFVPLMSFYWHKNATDELEEAAYRDGALWACYFYWTVSATWWLLWRGGIAAPVNGVLIFFGTIFISLIVWMWKKYR